MGAYGYTIALDLAGRPVVVVGGGPVAEARAWSLRSAGALVTVLADEVTPGLEELARRGEVTLLRKGYEPGDLAGAFLVLVTGRERPDSAAIFAEAEQAGALCNAEDDVAHSHFAVPATVRRGDLTVTISTAGRVPALAKRLRQRLEGEIGPEHGLLVELLAEARAELAPVRASVTFAQWAAAWEAVLDCDDELLTLIAEGRDDDARHLVRTVLCRSLQEAAA